MVNFISEKDRFKKVLFAAVFFVFMNSSSKAAFIKGWFELKGGIQFIDTTITRLTDTITVDPHLVINHELYPLEASYCVLSDNSLATVVSFGYDVISGELDKYYFGGGLADVYKVDFSRVLVMLGGRKYFGTPGKENNTCWYFGADLGMSRTIGAYIDRKSYSGTGDLTGNDHYRYESMDVVFRFGAGAEYWLNRNFGFAVNLGYVWSKPHISGTAYGIEDRDFSGAFAEASVLYDFMAYFDRKK